MTISATSFGSDAAYTQALAWQEDITLLNRIINVQAEIAAARLNVDGVMDLVARRAQELTHADGAAVELAEGPYMVYKVATGIAAGHVGVRINAAGSLSGMCVRTREILRCDDSELDSRVDLKACRQVGLRSMIVVPLFHDSRSVGVLKVISGQPSFFSEKDVKTLQRLAGLIGTALGRLEDQAVREKLLSELEHANQQLAELVSKDGLTGLKNRRYFDTVLIEKFGEAKSSGHPISIIMIDIDHFKHYNDTFGHPAGDSLLKSVALILKNGVSENHIVARYGGEEFVVIMPETDRDIAAAIAEKLRLSVKLFAGGLSPVTISLGIATSTPEFAGPDILVDQADKALYYSKSTGRDRKTSFHEMMTLSEQNGGPNVRGLHL